MQCLTGDTFVTKEFATSKPTNIKTRVLKMIKEIKRRVFIMNKLGYYE